MTEELEPHNNKPFDPYDTVDDIVPNGTSAPISPLKKWLDKNFGSENIKVRVSDIENYYIIEPAGLTKFLDANLMSAKHGHKDGIYAAKCAGHLISVISKMAPDIDASFVSKHFISSIKIDKSYEHDCDLENLKSGHLLSQAIKDSILNEPNQWINL